jgi:hypothetical protein
LASPVSPSTFSGKQKSYFLNFFLWNFKFSKKLYEKSAVSVWCQWTEWVQK